MTEYEYEKRSVQVLSKHWGKYRATHMDRTKGGLIPKPRVYAIDNDLVLAVLSHTEEHFVTCYHQHFNRPHGVDPAPTDSVAYKQMKFQDFIRKQARLDKLRDIRIIRGL